MFCHHWTQLNKFSAEHEEQFGQIIAYQLLHIKQILKKIFITIGQLKRFLIW